MLKNRLLVIFITICLVLGTLPFAMGATPQKSSKSVYISNLYVGAPHETVNQEYVIVKNKGTTDVSMKGWKIIDKIRKHTYKFPSSYILKAKKSVKIHTGKGRNTVSDLYWGKGWYVWNNDGDTAYLYNSKGILVSQFKVD